MGVRSREHRRSRFQRWRPRTGARTCFERRRRLMDDWAEYLAGRRAGTETRPLRASASATGSEAVSGRLRGISGFSYGPYVGWPRIDDRRSWRGTGRAESGGAAKGRGHRQEVKGPPSPSPSVEAEKLARDGSGGRCSGRCPDRRCGGVRRDTPCGHTGLARGWLRPPLRTPLRGRAWGSVRRRSAHVDAVRG